MLARNGQLNRVLIEKGFDVPATDYIRAQAYRRQLANALDEVFETVDAILSPTMP